MLAREIPVLPSLLACPNFKLSLVGIISPFLWVLVCFCPCLFTIPKQTMTFNSFLDLVGHILLFWRTPGSPLRLLLLSALCTASPLPVTLYFAHWNPVFYLTSDLCSWSHVTVLSLSLSQLHYPVFSIFVILYFRAICPWNPLACICCGSVPS